MSSHCGINQSVYREEERGWQLAPTPTITAPSGLRVLGAFLACLCLELLMLLCAKDEKGRANWDKLAEAAFWFVVIVGFAAVLL